MEDNQSKLESAAIILSKALKFLLMDGEGVYLKIDTKIDGTESMQNLIVFRKEDEIHIYNTDHEGKDGTKIMMDKYSVK